MICVRCEPRVNLKTRDLGVCERCHRAGDVFYVTLGHYEAPTRVVPCDGHTVLRSLKEDDDAEETT